MVHYLIRYQLGWREPRRVYIMDGKVKSFWVKVNEIIITYCFGLFMEKPYFCRDFLVPMTIWDKGPTHAQLISNSLTHNTVNWHILGQFDR